MNVKVEKVEKNVVNLEVSVDASKFEESLEKSFKKNAKRFNVQGFRRGKAPRSIVERIYGEEVLYEDAFHFAFNDTYYKAVEEAKIEPVAPPELDIVQIGKGQELIYTAKVVVKPEVELGEYIGVEIEEVEYEVTDELVDERIKEIARKNSRLVTIEDRPVQEGDLVVIDFEGFIEGEPFEGGKAEDYTLKIGDKQFIEGFEQQLIGSKTDDEVLVKVKFPEDYWKEELKGKDAEFKVKIKKIRYEEIPDIDDEFAKDVSEFDTIEEYRNDIKNKMLEEAKEYIKRETENRIIEKIVSEAKVDIPDVMIENAVEDELKNMDENLRKRGLSLEMYLNYNGISLDLLKNEMRTKAEKEIRAGLVLSQISTELGIECTEQDVDDYLKEYAERTKRNYEEVNEQYKKVAENLFKDSIIYKKTIEYIVNNAKIKKKELEQKS